MPSRIHRVVLLICGLAIAMPAIARAEPTFDPGVDRTGSAYGTFEFPRPR